MPPKRQQRDFTLQEDEMMILTISGNPCLWDIYNPEFKNVIKKEFIWAEIGKIVNKTKNECQKRWESIQNHYFEMKKEKSSKKKKRKFAHLDILKFLDSVKKDDPQVNLNVTEEILVDSDEESSSNTPKLHITQLAQEFKPLNENSIILKNQINEPTINFQNSHKELLSPTPQEDDIDLFFKTIAKTVRKFPPDIITQMKLKVFLLVMETEMIEQQIDQNFKNIKLP